MLEVVGLRKSYGARVALAGIDLTVAAGEIVGLLGSNGAGKSTLVSIIAGLRRADAGSVRVAGIDALRRSTEARAHIGLAAQDVGLYPTLTVAENLWVFGELAGMRRERIAANVEELAEALGLLELMDQAVQTLSGGQKRRVHAAAALVHRPRLLLLDEPTAGADVRARTELLGVLRRLAAQGSAILYATHYLAEVEALDASVAIIERGQVIARDARARLIEQYALAAVELKFDGPAPDLELEAPAERDGNVLRITTVEPGVTVAAALAALGANAARLRNVEIVQPSLESVYLMLTGRRYQEGSE